ncbi:ubiquitin-protein ligase [Trypanosoma grayi]|uniref:ubiquitin-protein ligase n=1 Tax=Trypanosoma grayi TaxID=71804 RepID=UPI0004F3F97E|nr:ubiquitin-protein ligase [Trypanosoma grayi]KEG14604.1 ubiquitin-protein ligase [Trypanosoma grayi]
MYAPVVASAAEVARRDKSLSVCLKSALSAYKQSKCETSCQRLLGALEGVCFSLCFGDEEFIRRFSVDRHATLLVSTLASVSPCDYGKVRPLTVQALSLLADLVPRGGFAIAAAKGVQPLLRLVKDTRPIGNDTLLEELLKCISHVALEANSQMVCNHAVAAIVALEARLTTHHLRMLCLKCLCHLLGAARVEEWSTYLAKPSSILMGRFGQQVQELLVDGRPAERLTKENEAYLLRLMECVAIVFDRMMLSGEIILKNATIVNEAVPALVSVLKQIPSMGSQAAAFRDAACSPLLTLYLTDPAIAIQTFLKYHVLSSLCGVLSGVLSGDTRQLSYNGGALAEALLGNDVNAIPCIAEEQQITPLLEFLLTIMPGALVAHESDYYVTLPHYIWQWEDDFHNKSDCSDSLSKRLEEEYERQRKSPRFTPYEVNHASRLLKVDFNNMQYTSKEHSSYPHGIYRRSILAGYLHRRPMRCTCKESNTSCSPAFASVSPRPFPSLREEPKYGRREGNAARGISAMTVNGAEEEALALNDAGEMARGIPSLHDAPSRGFRQLNGDTNGRLVEGDGVCCCCVDVTHWRRGRNPGVNKGTNWGENNDKSDAATRDLLRDVREELLRSSFSRMQFLQGPVIKEVISWCLPVLITVIKRTVCPIIARHCSILILRCVDLVAEFFRVGRKGRRSDSSRKLRDKLDGLCPMLGNVFLYLATTCRSSEQIVSWVYPFRELHCDESFTQALLPLGLKPLCRMPSMSLACETQMSALSAMLILQFSCRPGVNLFTDNQKFILCQIIETFSGGIGQHQSILRSAVYGSTGAYLCSFHSTAESIEGVRLKLMEQVFVLMRGDVEAIMRGLLLVSSSVHSSSFSNASYQMGENPNPLDSAKGTIASTCSSHSIVTDVMARAEMHMDHPLGVQQVLGIHEYMKGRRNDLSSLVHGSPEFLDHLADTLRDSVADPVLDLEAREAFADVRAGLVRVMNEDMDLATLEEINAVERHPTRFTRRLRRSKAMTAMTNRMWTPLRVKLEAVGMTTSTWSHSSSRRSLIIDGAKYTLLDVQAESCVLSILPTTPLHYLAKYILLQLNRQYADGGRRDSEPWFMRRFLLPRGLELGNALSLPEPLLSDMEATRDGDDELSPSFPSVPHPSSNMTESRGSLSSGMLAVPLEPQGGTSASEQVLCVVSAAVPGMDNLQTAFQTPNSVGRMPLGPFSDKPNMITLDNIVFLCDGEPVPNLSASVLEVCSSRCYPEMMKERADTFGEGEKFERYGSPKAMQRVLSLWTTAHTIEYVIVKEPVIRSFRGNETRGIYKNASCSPKEVFARLTNSPGPQSCLGSVARLLDELRRILHASDVNVCQDEGRLCAALIHGFYNSLSALMLPPLTFTVLGACMNGQNSQHLASYILWNYPQVFGFDIRRTLLQLLLSVRRVPTASLEKMKEISARSSDGVSVHGLEWIRPDTSMRSTKKVTVEREDILGSGARVLRAHAMCPLSLSVEFKNENGLGVGPAMEFYNLFSSQIQDQKLQMWRTEEFTDILGTPARRVQLPLLPAASQTAESLSYFELLGLLVGRVLMEERVVDLPLHPCFLRGILGNVDKNHLSEIEPELNQHLDWLESLNAEELEACELMFVLPHSDATKVDGEIELCHNGATKPVNAHNISKYVRAVRRYLCTTVFFRPLAHFMQGLRYTVIPQHLELFSIGELQLLISGPNGKIWERPEDLKRDITTAHGYDKNSPVVGYLLDVVSNWDAPLQRAFLRFVSGSARIPLGGLQPPITVVRRAVGVGEDNVGNMSPARDCVEGKSSRALQQLMDESLPTVNTCAHYLKLPSYSSKAVLRDKLQIAVTEGQDCFLLT